MDEYIKKSEAVDVIVKYPYDIAGKTATAIKMIEDLPSADVVPKSEGESIITLNSQLEAQVFEQRKEIERLTEMYFQKQDDFSKVIEQNKDLNNAYKILMVLCEKEGIL